MVELTQEIVRELLDYDQETGVLTWRERDIKWFKDGKQYAHHNQSIWNGKYGSKDVICKRDGYIVLGLFKTSYYAHRIIWLWMTGEWPEGQIDHKNGIRDDNRWENLKEVYNIENSRNKINTNIKKRLVNMLVFLGVE